MGFPPDFKSNRKIGPKNYSGVHNVNNDQIVGLEQTVLTVKANIMYGINVSNPRVRWINWWGFPLISSPRKKIGSENYSSVHNVNSDQIVSLEQKVQTVQANFLYGVNVSSLRVGWMNQNSGCSHTAEEHQSLKSTTITNSERIMKELL